MGDQRKNLLIAASLVLATIVWGANNTTIGYIVRDWPVLWTTGTRLLFAGILLMAYAMRNLSWFNANGTATQAVTAKPGGTGGTVKETPRTDPVALATRE